jgi:hypothetical protein
VIVGLGISLAYGSFLEVNFVEWGRILASFNLEEVSWVGVLGGVLFDLVEVELDFLECDSFTLKSAVACGSLEWS